MAHETRAGRVRPWTVSQDLVGMRYNLRVAANARELESNLESIDKMIVMHEPPSPEFPKAQRELVLALKKNLEQLKDTREPTPAMRELEGAPIKALGMLEDLLIVVADHATDNDLWKLDARITNSIFKPSPFDLPEEKNSGLRTILSFKPFYNTFEIVKTNRQLEVTILQSILVVLRTNRMRRTGTRYFMTHKTHETQSE